MVLSVQDCVRDGELGHRLLTWQTRLQSLQILDIQPPLTGSGLVPLVPDKVLPLHSTYIQMEGIRIQRSLLLGHPFRVYDLLHQLRNLDL